MINDISSPHSILTFLSQKIKFHLFSVKKARIIIDHNIYRTLPRNFSSNNTKKQPPGHFRSASADPRSSPQYNRSSNGEFGRSDTICRSASADMKSPSSVFRSINSHFSRGSVSRSSSGDIQSAKLQRSSSAEPEFLRFWMEKDRRSSSKEQINMKYINSFYPQTDTG